MVNRPHEKLEAWKGAIEITKEVYRMTAHLPEGERFGLVSQMRRAAVSIASNIAEGAARNTKKEFIQFLFTAQGSLSELDTQLIICKELGFLSGTVCEKLDSQIETESKLVSGIIRFLKNEK